MSWLDDWKSKGAAMVAQFNNATFRDACMAACALIAAADGEIEKAEKQKTAKIIQTNDMLKCFEPATLGQKFEEFCGMATDDIKRLTALGFINKLKGKPEADTVMRVAVLIAKSDGDFEPAEKDVVKELAEMLGLPAEQFLK